MQPKSNGMFLWVIWEKNCLVPLVWMLRFVLCWFTLSCMCFKVILYVSAELWVRLDEMLFLLITFMLYIYHLCLSFLIMKYWFIGILYLLKNKYYIVWAKKWYFMILRIYNGAVLQWKQDLNSELQEISCISCTIYPNSQIWSHWVLLRSCCWFILLIYSL